jgi:4-hydroxybenzoate polyprenyltransferase
MRGKRQELRSYLSLVKFAHTVFAMPFAIMGYFLAVNTTEHSFDLFTFVLVILCMVFARNAAMGFNRYIDRDIDAKNSRTAIREIPKGIIKPSSALKFVVLNVLLFIVATWFINKLTFFLSPIALMVILGYSLTKRFTSFCHLVLGLGLSLAPLGAYLAVTGEFHWLPLVFSGIVLTWSGGFDIIYALQDESFDKKEKLKSIPVLLGKERALIVSVFLHAVSGFLVLFAGITAGLGTWYWIGAVAFLVMLVYQHILVKPADLSKVNLAFFTSNGIASIVYALFFLLDVYYS